MPIAANVLISGRLAIFPSWFPIEKRYYFQTQQEADNFTISESLRLDAEAELFSKRYDLSSFIAINQFVKVDILDWLGLRDSQFVKEYGLPEAVKKALAYEVANIARDQDSKRREQERLLEMKNMEYNSQLKFGASNTSFGKVYG
jgi:hypothetical protein